MKIKIAAVLAVLALLPAAADAQVREVGFGYGDISKDVAVIGGRTDMGKDTKITVSVFKKDKSYADINADGEDVSDILVNADTAYADDGGNWSVEWKAAESGGYDIYISEN